MGGSNEADSSEIWSGESSMAKNQRTVAMMGISLVV